ncbi:kinase-like domain-containing protein [Mortierella sp. GBAus27b]|nr:MAP/microtubule affinity-regulating kinase 4 [Mortierella sp. GBA43]KAI8351060.1 kinase-like domain-containing protein [Mortierella sp. GBAus27b]
MSPSPDASLPGIAHYTFLKQLGRGRFCVVHLARHFYTEKLCAIKVIDKQAHKPDILFRLRREIELMESLDHPNIVKLQEVIETQFTIYVCMEYVEGRSLEQHLKAQEHGRVSERAARRITRELASAISHCHSRFVVHRDIKPANILITTTGKVMLIDFGLGNNFSPRSRLNTICGSLPYYSPEIARGSHYTGPEVDIWCLGVVLYRMTVGRDPFVGATKREVKHQIIQQGFYPPGWLSHGLRTTLRTLLVHDSTQRRSLSILENDPWLHEDSPPFLSEDRSMTETSRLSGATLVRQSSKATKRQSHTDSYYSIGKSRSLFGSRSAVGDALNAGVWQLDKHQPRFRKNRIRIIPCAGAQDDLLFQKDADLSLLQFLMPILRSCHVSYYLHSTSRILCGTSFVRETEGFNQASLMLQKLIYQVGAAMTGGSVHQAANQCLMPRCGVFSIDIVKAKGDRGGHILVIKRLFGSSLTIPYFKRQFLYNATLRDAPPSPTPSSL